MSVQACEVSVQACEVSVQACEVEVQAGFAAAWEVFDWDLEISNTGLQ